MARNKKVEILSNGQEVLHPITDGDCVIFSDGQTLTQKLSEDDSVKYTPEVTNSSPMFKVGEGNTVDYSANVLDGAYERAVLIGQTYTNNIQESSADEVTLPTPFTTYERTQHNTLTSSTEGTLGINLVGQSYTNALQHDSEESYVVLGEDLEFQSKKVEYTNEGQIKSAMLKGQTLVNHINQMYEIQCEAGGYERFTIMSGKTLPAGTYILLYNVVKTGGEATESGDRNTPYYTKVDGTKIYQGWENFNSTTGKKYWIFTSDQAIETMTYWCAYQSEEVHVKDFVLLTYQEGMENWDIPYFEGMQSVTVSTKLENLCHKHTTSSLAKTGKTFKSSGSINDRVIQLVNLQDGNASSIYGMKPNTKYLVQFKISNLVLDGLSSITMQFSTSTINNGNCVFVDGVVRNLIKSNGVYRVILTTSDLLETSNIEIKGVAEQWESSDSSLRSMTISEIMYVEYQNGMENWDLPYFEDYQVMKPVQVESINKNIIDFYDYTLTSHGVTATITNGVWKITGTSDSDGGRNATYRYSTILKANKTYVFTLHDLVENKDSVPGIYVSNSTTGTAILKVGLEGGIVKTESNYTPTEDTLVHVWFNRYTGATYDTTFKLMLEESDTATEYVPHQSKTTYSWDEVILRKIGDVEDTLDLTTGEYVQRIGEIVLDGSDDEVWRNEENNTTYAICKISLPQDVLGNADIPSSHIKCDNIMTGATNEESNGKEQVSIYHHKGDNYNYSEIRICLPISYLPSVTVQDFRNYIKNHPFKVQYQLETPIVHKVNLSRPNLQVYDDITHVHTKCLDGTLIPNIYLPAEVSYPVGVEPETTYNVCVNHEVSSSNPLVCNVGGSTFTVTQPRTLITVPQGTKTISFSGKDNVISEVMMIKNSSLLTRDLPHFNGVSSVQLGKTINNLCRSDGMMVGNAVMTYIAKNDSIDMAVNKAGSAVWIFPLSTTLKSDKKYFVYAPNTYPSACASFRGVKNGVLGYGYEATAWTDKKYCIITPKQNIDFPYTHLCIGCHDSFGTVTITLQRPIICEYEQGMENWDWESIGYFTGSKNIGCEFMKVQNKNLFDGQLVNGYINIDNGSRLQWESHFSSKNFIRVYPSLNYKLPRPSIIANDQVYALFEYDKNKQYIGYMYLYDSTTTYIPQDNVNYIIVSGANNGQTLQALANNIQIEESSTATSYTAHKENTLYVRKDQSIDLTWEQGRINPSGVGDSYTNAINNTVSYGVRNKGLLNLKPNTTYRLSLGDTTTYKWHIALFDNWDCALQASNLFGLSGDWSTAPETLITTTKDYHKIGINIQRQDSGSLSASTVIPCRLEEVQEIKLRSASGKYDELDITRGKYIQRVGELYIDGSNVASQTLTKVGDTYQPTDTTLNTYDVKCPGAIFSARVHINHFAPRDGGVASPDISYESAAIHSANQSCRITISKSKASTLEEFKVWLSKNPLTIVYALNDSSEMEHDIVFIGNKNETGTEITKPNGVFTLPTLYTEQTHIELQNNGLMPKVESRDYIEYPIISAMGRTFTLQHNSIGSSDLTIDLCGRTQTIPYSSPKSLVYSDNENYVYGRLRISGAGNKISKVMLLDGGHMDRDIPYIEGMKNAVNPIVKNVGKNLITNKIVASYSDVVVFEICKLKPNKQYIISSNYNFMAGLVTLQGNDKQFIIQNWTQDKKVFKAPADIYDYNTIKFWKAGLSYDKTSMYFHMQELEDEVQPISYEPYKENICYVDCGEIRLTPDMFEQGTVLWSNQEVGTPLEGSGTILKYDANNRIRLKGVIKAKPNTKYIISINDDYDHLVLPLDSNKCKTNYTNNVWCTKGVHIITTTSNTEYITYVVAKQGKTIIPTDFNNTNVKLYELESTVHLRSLPNGVYDEIDLETGKYIRRVGEITFNGSESWIQGYQSWENKNTFYTNGITYSDGNIKVRKGENGSGQAYDDSVRCGELQRTYMQRIANNETYGVCSYFYSGYQRIFVRVPNITTSDELKLWLSQNPITVQYELETPIVKDIVIHNYPHSYKGGHVLIENGDSNTPIPAQITYRAVTNRSGQIQQHTEQVEKQEREINELEMLILANISNQTR